MNASGGVGGLGVARPGQERLLRHLSVPPAKRYDVSLTEVPVECGRFSILIRPFLKEV
jgi:hypothetical protein